MSQTMKIRKGDIVHILSGKDRGKEGRVLDALPKQRKVIVENLNVVKRHTRPRPLKDSSRMGGPQVAPGGIVEKAAPVHVANVMLVCPVCRRPTRIGMVVKQTKDGPHRARVCKRADCGQEVDK